MSAMDHAAAHERIQDLLLEPARLAAVEESLDPEDVALREHLSGCPACRSDLQGWARLGRAVVRALPHDHDAALAAVEPMNVPGSLRARVVGAVHAAAREGAERDGGIAQTLPLEGERRDKGRGRAQRLAPWLGLAAAVTLIVGASWITLDQANLRAEAEREAAALSEVVATMDRVFADDHRIVQMRAMDGSTAGSISWSRHDWVVLTSALSEPAPGMTYQCWLEDAGRSVAVGEMEFAGETAYWVAAVDPWQTWEIGPATRFVVSLEAGDPASRTGEVVLSAELGS